ncbi:MAG: hypothetical protein NTW54_03740 [Bacteroidetes bacterium]|nr:hypothetical protein [Bacteroidota bacterium]
MTEKEFVIKMQYLLQSKQAMTLDTALVQITAYDSLSRLVLMAYLNDDFGIKITAQELHAMTLLNDIFTLICNAT